MAQAPTRQKGCWGTQILKSLLHLGGGELGREGGGGVPGRDPSGRNGDAVGAWGLSSDHLPTSTEGFLDFNNWVSPSVNQLASARPSAPRKKAWGSGNPTAVIQGVSTPPHLATWTFQPDLRDSSHCSDSAGSLTHCAARELLYDAAKS